jgi:hypothetical protein
MRARSPSRRSSGGRSSTARSTPQAKQLGELTEEWFQSCRRANALGWDYLNAVSTLFAPQQLRSRWMADAKEVVAEQMRSQAFLEMMRINLNALTSAARFTSPFGFR